MKSQRMQPARIAIVGGGAGGLVTAYQLDQLLRPSHEVTLFESSDRLGGKLRTARFAAAPVSYEVGAAELYDYSHLGPDPLRDMVRRFGLATKGVDGRAAVLNDELLRSEDDLRRVLGERGYRELEGFRRRARSLIAPSEFYDSLWITDNADPLARQRFSDLLAGIGHEGARRYVSVIVHSDLATEPSRTSAMYGLENFLMNEPDYLRLYAIDGGNERLAGELARRISADVRLRHRVTRVERLPGGTYHLSAQDPDGKPCRGEFDVVVAALPNNWLTAIEWGDATLARAMDEHHDHYDHPAHYLRATLLFDRPFWRTLLNESYFMLDAFGGCCVYDEGARWDGCAHGVLAWLLAGEAAMTMNNFDDAEIARRVLDSLPTCLKSIASAPLESRVSRWMGAVNARPGGYPLRHPIGRHRPEPQAHPNLYVVGDYLFDATLNGVVDSANTVAECVAASLTSGTLHDVGAPTGATAAA